MSNAKTRNSDATLSANENASFEKVRFAHDPNTIPITSFETDTASNCNGSAMKGREGLSIERRKSQGQLQFFRLLVRFHSGEIESPPVSLFFALELSPVGKFQHIIWTHVQNMGDLPRSEFMFILLFHYIVLHRI